MRFSNFLPVTGSRHHNGFTLIELMLIVVVIAVLAAVAIPTYDDFITRSRRSEATIALSEIANLEEKFFSNNLRYVNVFGSLSYNNITPNGFYTLGIELTTTIPYTITATAQGKQASDDADCGTISLTSVGEKTPNGCW